MQNSYIDYAMSVIVGRALPEVRDGLKPVHRRVLYAMYDSGFRPDRSHAKVGTFGRRDDGQLPPARRLVDLRHPGADGAAMVAALPLVDGQGNFGSPGNDPATDHRYCVPAMRWCGLPLGQSVRIDGIAPGAHRARIK